MRWIRLLVIGYLALFFPASASSQQTSKAETLEVVEEGENYVLRVPISSVVITLPKSGLVRLNGNIGGGTASPRYFQFKHEKQPLIVSGWFESARGFKGIKDFAAKEGLLNFEDVSFEEVGIWSAVFYDQRFGKIRMSNLRAEFVQAETWVDLHLSFTGGLPLAEQRARLREVLQLIQVSQRAPEIITSAPGNGPVHQYAIPGHGILHLRVPDGWQDFSKPLTNPPSVLMRFRPSNGDNKLDLQITAVWLDPGNLAKRNTPESLRETVLQYSKEPLKRAVEKEVQLQEIRGEETNGYYFFLTDRNPAPGEFKYMTQGSSVTGEILVVFTFLQSKEKVSDRKSALDMVTSAKYVK